MEAALIIIYLLFVIFMLVTMWTIYAKAGKPGWAALIPIYNIIVFMEIIKKPWWWLFLWMIPVVNYVFIIWGLNLLAKKFGKSEGFTVGLVLLAFVFFPILAFDKSSYEGIEKPASDGPDSLSTQSSADIILLIIILFQLLNSIIMLVMPRLLPGWYMGSSRYIQASLYMIAAFIPLILGFIINNKTLKILGIIFGALVTLVTLYQNISWLVRM